MKLLPVVLAAGLCGCFVGRVASLPTIEPRTSSPIRIFLVVKPHQPRPGPLGSDFGGWWDSASFAAFLEWSGFKPWVVQNAAEVPPDQPFIENVTYESPNGCQGGDPWVLLTLLTVGVIPGVTCEQEATRSTSAARVTLPSCTSIPFTRRPSGSAGSWGRWPSFRSTRSRGRAWTTTSISGWRSARRCSTP